MQKLNNIEEKKLMVLLSQKDVNTIFKFLGRADLKGLEVPEFNSVISMFESAEIKNADQKSN